MMWSIDRTSGAVVSSSLNPTPADGDGAHASDVAIARVDAIPRDGLVEVEADVEGEPESLILHRDDAGAVRAWRNVCPHAGRRLDWAPGQFLRAKDGSLVCAVHGASFELEGGRCVAGPCRGESLRAVAVHCVEGDVRVGPASPAAQGQ